ncbi:hypothetical protein B0J12DRAFT_670573 [Macrophomina phaseolina]|uniref:Uncharacterized protein n=1 Tax=Macrophomina phaseolina TaxID=35725 RepID=A0ABQ8G4E7_9PEZI|nr:hypothetical protein B0J12DRAFT_670573 [Macrophomina phaseolina]
MSCPQPLPDSPAHRAETVVPQLSCDCLQRSTKVLSGVKALEMNVRFQVDAALLYIRTATTTWVQVLQCASCQRGNAEEILYISLSGVRAALRYLVAIFSSEGDQLTTHPPSPGCRFHVAQSPLTPQEMPIGDDCKPFSRRVSSAIGKSTLGGYDIDSDEQELLVRFIAIRLVRDMRDALSVLEGRIEEQNSAATWLAQPTGVLADNSALLQSLLRGVKELASSLQKSLCISSTAEIQRHF